MTRRVRLLPASIQAVLSKISPHRSLLLGDGKIWIFRGQFFIHTEIGFVDRDGLETVRASDERQDLSRDDAAKG